VTSYIWVRRRRSRGGPSTVPLVAGCGSGICATLSRVRSGVERHGLKGCAAGLGSTVFTMQKHRRPALPPGYDPGPDGGAYRPAGKGGWGEIQPFPHGPSGDWNHFGFGHPGPGTAPGPGPTGPQRADSDLTTERTRGLPSRGRRRGVGPRSDRSGAAPIPTSRPGRSRFPRCQRCQHQRCQLQGSWHLVFPRCQLPL